MFKLDSDSENKATLFKVTEPSSVPYRTPPACAKWAVTVGDAESYAELWIHT